MKRWSSILLFSAFFLAGTVGAQVVVAPGPFPKPAPTAEERAFAQLPPDIQAMLGGMSAANALQMVNYAYQQLVALGIPNPSREQYRIMLGALLSPPSTSVGSASAGTTTFPPVSPLVPRPQPLPR